MPIDISDEMIIESGKARFSVAEGRFRSQSFEVKFEVCPSPTCHCPYVTVECTPLVQAVPGPPEGSHENPIRFDLDVFEQKVDETHRTSRDGRALAESLLSEMLPEHWQSLKKLFFTHKHNAMRGMNLAELEVAFPKDIEEGETTMVGYNEIFPWADGFAFAFDGEPWMADDQYCVARKCRCTETGITFIPVRKEPGGTFSGHSNEAVAAYFDYRKGRTKPMNTVGRTGPKAAQLAKALKAEVPDLHETLRLRHRQLRELARLHLFPRAGLWEAPAPAQLSGTPDPAPLSPVFSSPFENFPKVGRNEPCPCGSGKKYKKCCGQA